jgi:hypothetical protein
MVDKRGDGGESCAGTAPSSAEQYGLSFGDGLRIYVDAQQQRLVLERHYPQYGLCGRAACR